MNKIKNYIREKLICLLEIDKINQTTNDLTQLLKEQTELFNKYIDKNYKMFQEQTNTMYTLNSNTRNSFNAKISHFQDSVDTLHNTVENVVHIGTDACRVESGHSWAVICVEGKMNMVKFIDLNRKDAREIFDFLKYFEAGRHCVDASYQEMFYNGLFKF